ncbi:MAG TPA: hypothetical protein D7H86_02965 [Candidatus Poseidoniales archaeon]|nr:MAG TPA: hypothetical protein D7H86_02965 [Candidatus Poseidoniales archaeon]
MTASFSLTPHCSERKRWSNWIEGKPGRYVNVAEAKIIVEAIDDIAKDLASIPHPDDRYWEIAVISFYKAQAAAIQKALTCQ